MAAPRQRCIATGRAHLAARPAATRARASAAGPSSPASARSRASSSGALADDPARAGAAERRGPHRRRRARAGAGRLVRHRRAGRTAPPAPQPERPAAGRRRRALGGARAGRVRGARGRVRAPTATGCWLRRRARCSSAPSSGRGTASSTGRRCEAAAGMLVGRHDFAALTPSARLYHSCVRECSRRAGTSPALQRRRAHAAAAAARRHRALVRDHAPAASCTTWCASPSARWSTWPRVA